jgi:hypothetical protein
MEDNSPAKERMEKIEAVLDEYERQCGFPPIKSPGQEQELDEYLSMGRDTIEKLTPEAAGSLSYRLSQFAFYIQRLYNRERSRKTWADSELNRVIAAHIEDYSRYIKYDMRAAMVCRENAYATNVQSIVRYATQRMQRLEDLSEGIQNLALAIKSVGYMKQQLNKNL